MVLKLRKICTTNVLITIRLQKCHLTIKCVSVKREERFSNEIGQRFISRMEILQWKQIYNRSVGLYRSC